MAKDFEPPPIGDEWQPIALNYTSGTTGNPKGVVFHHRGTYLETIGHILSWHLPPACVYLWTLPMFHANGWCFPWSVTAMGGTHVCLRRVDPALIFRLIAAHRVTRTSRRSRSRRCCCAIPPSPWPRWSRVTTRSGERRRARSWSSGQACQ